jgi:transcriptional regulator with XRE-family HTH domain
MVGSDLRAILSRNIRLYRGRRALSQAELAEKANISIAFLSNIERDNKWPYPDTLVNIAKGLDVEVFELFKPESLNSETAKTISQLIKDISTSFGRCLDTISQNYLEKEDK